MPAARGAGDTPLRQLEEKMAVLVNRVRATHELPPLQGHPILTRLAREHSRAMRRANRVGHEDPETGGLFHDRARAAGLPASSFGENVARDRSITSAHLFLLDSPGHRANILSEDFTHLGIGIVPAESGSLYVTQTFARIPDRDPRHAVRRILDILAEERAAAGLPPLLVRPDLEGILTGLAEEMRRADGVDPAIPATLPRPVETLAMVLPDPERMLRQDPMPRELARLARSGSQVAIGVAVGTAPSRPEGALFALVAVLDPPVAGEAGNGAETGENHDESAVGD
jgi:uncharacterized protein YkwD